MVELLWRNGVETVNSCEGDPTLMSAPVNIEIMGAMATIGFTDLGAALTLHEACFKLEGSSTITTVDHGRYHHVEFDPAMLRNPEIDSLLFELEVSFRARGPSH